MDNASVEEQRRSLLQTIEDLRQRGLCYSCHDLATGDVFGGQYLVFDDELFRVALEPFPRMLGHIILLYKPHREDLTDLNLQEAGRVFAFCILVAKAIKEALGAEKVYVNTMCDGGINHFHLQLLPRYPGDPIGSTRFVCDRTNVTNGHDVAKRVRDVLLRLIREDTSR